MKAKVELEVEIDVDDATHEEVEEYLMFEFGYSGGVSLENPCVKAGHNITDFYCDIIY